MFPELATSAHFVVRNLPRIADDSPWLLCINVAQAWNPAVNAGLGSDIAEKEFSKTSVQRVLLLTTTWCVVMVG